MPDFHQQARQNIRVTHTRALDGDPMIESGPAYLVNLNHTRERGTKVTAEIEIQFDGLPAITNAGSGS
ncbi:hypothetical protein ACLBWS_03715 [Brucellaceae bacterium D45D]